MVMSFDQLDSYNTPAETIRSIWSKLGGRFYFHLAFWRIIRACGNDCRHGLFDRAVFSKHSDDCFRLAEKCGGRFEINGLNNIADLTGPVVFIGNHMSQLETIALPVIIPDALEISYVVKHSLTKVPYFGDIMRFIDAVVVGRENPRDDFKTVMDNGCAKLAAGVSLILFPQSTRAVEFSPERFNTIGVKLAKRAGVPVVPVALKTDFLQKGFIIKDFGPIHPERPIHFEFGRPMLVEGNGKDTHNQIIEFIQSRLERWRTD